MRLALSSVAALAALLQLVTALPTEQRATDGKLKIVKTTTLPNGQIIDWAITESQGNIASPPPAPKKKTIGKSPVVPSLNGPKGTVPIPRKMGSTPHQKQLPPISVEGVNTNTTKRSNAGTHWYASSGQPVNNHGGGASFSLYNPYVESPNDFSLIQTAVIRDGAPNAQYGTVDQTVEAGWQKYPSGSPNPHLFTYFTTCGYNADGDNVGGYNRDVAGWVQTDSTIYPGYEFMPYATDGGEQYEIQIEYKFMNNNWWLFVLDRYIGYYPASLFSQGVDASQTLAAGSNRINFYGEVYNSEDAITTTAMGSGEYAEAGFGHAAFILNIVYTDTSDNDQGYDGSSQIVVSPQTNYDLNTFFNSGTNYGSYMYLGGPGGAK